MQPRHNPPEAGRILVVEDEQVVREVLKSGIRRMGYTPLDAMNIKEAIDHIKTWRVDLMLLDLHLAGGDGMDLLKLLHRHKWTVPTVVVSAFISDEVAQELVGLGVVGMVSKPFKMERIAEEIQRVLKKDA
ncbi:MAG: response regulator [bacterium]|nr:response regulator [bacterium]